MSAPPPVPPRPSYYGSGGGSGDAPPPLPPLPANYAYDPVFDGPAPPHWEDPLAAPRPFRYDPGIPADMAQQLERQLSLAGHAQTASGYAPAYVPPPPPPPSQDPYRLDSGGFAPPRSLPTPLPPTASGWNAPPTYPATPQPYGYPSPGYPQPPLPPPAPAQAAGWQSPPPVQNQRQSFVLPPLGAPIDQQQSPHGSTFGHSRNSSGGSIQMPGFPGGGGFGATLGIPSAGLRSSTPALPQASQFSPAPLPAPSSFAPTGSNQNGMSTLEISRPTTQSLSEKAPAENADADTKVTWAKEVLSLVERTHAASASKGSMIVDPALNKLVERAIKDILDAAALNPPVASGLALFLRGQLAGNGSFPTFVPRNPKNAFADYDAAAKAGYAQAWFSIAREYETVGDVERAKQCLERGIKANIGSCYYRLGMAHLVGQLNLRPDPNRGLSMLHRAAQLANPDVPQPAYVFALLFLGAFPSYNATPQQMAPFLPPGSTPQLESKRYLERAAYFGSGAAQFKLGHAYEFGEAPFPPDPLLSVQYYSLAAQRGHPEADLALSKWFLCGSDGAFEKDEVLAKTFAEKSAMRGEKEGEFAMGYYCEVGIGAPNKTKDLESARKWYALAAEKGSAEAKKRLDALQAAQPVVLGREEHEQLKDANLVRRRTQARDEAWAAGRRAKQQAHQGMPPLAEEVRKAHMPVEPAVPVAAPAAVITANPVQPQPLRRPSGPPDMPLNTSFPSQQASELGPATPLSARPQPSNVPMHGGRVRIPIRLDDPGPVSAGPGTGPASPHISSYRPPAGPSAVGGRVTAGAFGSRLPSGGASSSPASASVPAPAAAPVPAPKAEALTPPAPAPVPLPGSAAAAPNTPPKKPQKGPQTFQEMGFHSQKLDEKECVIM